VGPNGAGKTTLLRTLAGQLPALRGFVRIGKNVQLAYLSQLRDRALPGDTVLDAMLAAAPLEPGAARSYLARFLFRGDDVAKPVRELSGGERSRLELAMLGIGGANLLLLDEPTNHLDIPAREALESFLRESPAALVVVSHDRRLLENVCERLWVVEPARDGGPAVVVPFDGGYRAWRAALAEGWSAATAATAAAASASGAPRAAVMPRAPGLAPRAPGLAPRVPATTDGAGSSGPRSAGGPARATADAGTTATPAPRADTRTQPQLSKDVYRRERRRIEDELARLGGRREELEAALVDLSVRSNFVELRRLTTELADVDGALARAEDAWLALEERAPR
jgi:energy-coupling factor transporter ATP-binding protein EcfA2